MSRPKRIGILGGISYESTIKYYELIMQKYYKKKKDYHYPELVIFSFDFQKFTDFENKGEMEKYVQYIIEGVRALESAGVEFIIMAANSPHAVFNQLEKQAKVPMLSIVKVTAERAKKEGLKTLLLLGIKFTMQSSFYQKACEQLGIKVLTPSNAEQDEVNKIIFEELVIGKFEEKSKKKLLGIISNYNVDGVILGCTELPLILKQKDAKTRLLNTMEIHAEAALEYSLSG